MDLQSMGLHVVNWIRVARGSEPSGFIRGGEFLE